MGTRSRTRYHRSRLPAARSRSHHRGFGRTSSRGFPRVRPARQVNATPDPDFYVLAGVLLAISFSGPLSAGAGGIPDAPVAPPSTVAFMLAMHMVEAAIVVVLLTRLAGMGGRPPHPEPKEPGK